MGSVVQSSGVLCHVASCKCQWSVVVFTESDFQTHPRKLCTTKVCTAPARHHATATRLKT